MMMAAQRRAAAAAASATSAQRRVAAAAASATRIPTERPAAPSDPGVGVGTAVVGAAVGKWSLWKTVSRTAPFLPSSDVAT